jgi:uronate dehydrogenase
LERAAYNIFNAASAAGCSRVVVASTTQVMNGYGGADSAERKERGIGPEGVPWDAPVAPTNLYGASKAWAEALARVYSSSHDLSCICVRLGGFQADGQVFDEEASRVQMHNVSPRDAAQIFRLAIEAPPSVRCAIVPGISEHAVAFQNVQHTKAVLGYVPQDGTATRTNSRL